MKVSNSLCHLDADIDECSAEAREAIYAVSVSHTGSYTGLHALVSAKLQASDLAARGDLSLLHSS